ncbi:MAG: hypothetical protein RMI34_05725 [Chloroherpetonaceae bacterium]|nr:hypothetical protein [Chloroherpetonaceae bacterium]
MSKTERPALPARISFHEWLRALLFSPGILFTLLYLLATLLMHSPLRWLLEWAAE